MIGLPRVWVSKTIAAQWRRIVSLKVFMLYLKVVAGLLYNLVLEVGESEYCEKDGDSPLETVPSLEECPVNVDTV